MDQFEYFQSHPPHCLTGFSTQPIPPPGEGTHPGGGHFHPVFSLACRCGGTSHTVHGFRWRDPTRNNRAAFLSPLSLTCATCGRNSELLDLSRHGHDGELAPDPSALPQGEPSVHACPTCGPQPFELFVRLEYPDDLFDGSYETFAGREQDLFTWFFLLGRCTGCGHLQEIIDFECA